MDICVDGITAFASQPMVSYRYVIELKNSTISISMEDRSSKKRWSESSVGLFKGNMVKSDYVLPDNAIPDTSAADYFEYFRDALEGPTDVSDVRRNLYLFRGGVVRLELAVTIRNLYSTKTTKYVFHLEPVPEERIYILESKVRDLQDEVEKLRGIDASP
ncbi:hypothetical protein GN958_ATG22441, partial [Phytophthora infestans]